MDDTIPLRRSVLHAVGWATATRFLAQMVNWAMTLATIRFLSPQDYGLMAVAMTIVSFIGQIGSVGICDAVVQKQDVVDADLPNIFGLVLVINSGCLLLLWLLAYPAAWFYGEARLAAVLLVASVLMVPTAFQALPNALLNKRLDLKAVSRVDAIARISGGALVLGLAWAGGGVWSLIAGPIWVAVLRAVGFTRAAKYFQFPHFRFAALAEVIRIGGLRSIEQVLWNIYANADVFIIGKLLGTDLVGIYFVSRNLAALPVEKFAATVKPVIFPAFALVQDDRSQALYYLQKATRLLSFVCFPILFGLAATSSQVVALVLGPKWSGTATPVAILAMAMALRPIGLLIPPFLMGLGEFAASVRNMLFGAILFPIAIVIGSHWGLVGVCEAWLAAYPIQLLVLVRRAALVSHSSISSLLIPIVPPLIGALLMYAIVRWAGGVLPGGLGTPADLLSLVAIGVFVYAGYTLAFLRPLAFELARLARR